ncbi:AraC family transcriptional regulator [Catenuloplanes sp. NPDC051500]|uniref:AraC family transcriptional regulator n=1 Tax=Catenuloplanes sp. NPDC051500 TaxID=3363959 RepID=UPI0037A99EFD
MISEAIGALHAGRPFAARASRQGEWGFRLPGIGGMGFHVVVGGEGWLTTAAGPPRRLRTGDVVLVPYGTEHGLSHRATSRLGELPMMLEPSWSEPAGDSTHIDLVLGCYRLDQPRLQRFVRDLPPVVVISLDQDRHPEMRALIEMLSADVSAETPGTSATRAALVDLTLAHALRHGWEQTRHGMSPVVTDPGIAAAIEQMHLHPQRPWTLQSLGEVAGMSRTTFKQQFTAMVGTPPIGYLIEWRLASAARALRESAAPLAVIARQVGYSSAYAFGNAFRRRFGVSPGRFRQRATAVPAMTAAATRTDLDVGGVETAG